MAPGPAMQPLEHIPPALPTDGAEVEVQCVVGDWIYVVTRYPFSELTQRFTWSIGEPCWTEIVLH